AGSRGPTGPREWTARRESMSVSRASPSRSSPAARHGWLLPLRVDVAPRRILAGQAFREELSDVHHLVLIPFLTRLPLVFVVQAAEMGEALWARGEQVIRVHVDGFVHPLPCQALRLVVAIHHLRDAAALRVRAERLQLDELRVGH